MTQARFNQHGQDYDKHAQLQVTIAAELLDFISEETANTTIKNAADLGCGTGNLALPLALSLSEVQIDCCDIAPKMLEVCQQKARTAELEKRCTFHQLSLPPGQNYQLICSSMAFQWFEQLPQTFQEIHSKLANNGLLAFSLPVDDTFSQLRELYLEQDLEYPGLNYHRAPELKSQLKNLFSQCQFRKKTIRLSFKNLATFLRQLHAIGAISETKTAKSATILRRLLRAHGDKEFFIDYNILYGVCRP